MINQFEITLPSYTRGYHIITNIINREIGELPEKGIINIFIKHTSAALTINENADPSVTIDFERFMNHLIPDGDKLYSHTMEGPDDMAAHIKSSTVWTIINHSNYKSQIKSWDMARNIFM